MLITVSQLNNYIKGTLETDGLLNNIEVKGEVNNLQLVRDNMYFVLKDANTQVDCFAYSSKDINISNGSTIIANSRVSYYTQLGKLSLFVVSAKKVNDKGEQLLKLLELKEKLHKQGCFSKPKKKINIYPKRIGVVSSSSGAVIQDIIKVSNRRNASVDIVLYNSKVQGINAEIEIAEAIEFFSGFDVDTVIVARGGGSDTDLSAFNTERVVRAINNCNKPVISAVGHEVDYTLCDLAADVRAATPSEAAEIAVADVKTIKNQLLNYINNISNNCLTIYSEYCNFYSNSLNRIVNNSNYVMNKFQSLYLRQINKLDANIIKTVSNTETKLIAAINTLDAHNPLKRLKQGYAYLTVNNNKVNIDELQPGQQVVARVHKGKLTMSILQIDKEKT